jgi:tartrate dehydratase alpha subunit/fumarate hydratase class I-like protein
MIVQGNHPIAEIIAKCMSGVEIVPKEYMKRMVNKACREAVKYHESALRSINLVSPAKNRACHVDPLPQVVISDSKRTQR